MELLFAGALFSTGALVAVSAKKDRRREGRRLSLPEVLSRRGGGRRNDLSTLPVVFVHVHEVNLQPHCAADEIKVRVKLGHPGVSWCCNTSAALAQRPAKDVAANFVADLDNIRPSKGQTAPVRFNFGSVGTGQTCCFLGRPREDACVRLRVLRSSILHRTIGRADLSLPAHFQSGFPAPGETRQEDFDVKLSAEDQHVQLGNISISIEMRLLPLGDLRHYLQLVGAERQKQSYLLAGDAAHITVGRVTPRNAEAKGNPVRAPRRTAPASDASR